MTQDPELERQREALATIDRAILELLNRRFALVRSVRRHKLGLGLPFEDPTQEARLLADLQSINPGPLTAETVHTLFQAILAALKRDAARD